MPRQGAVTLSDLIAPTLTLDCEPCSRKGVYSVARLDRVPLDYDAGHVPYLESV
jgi:hypothetical protein